MSGLVNYPCPLGGLRSASLFLPSDLTAADVRRIIAMLQTLAPEADTPVASNVGPRSLDVVATTGCKVSTEMRKP